MSKKTVLKLMRGLGLQSPVRRRRRYNSFRGEVGKTADNVLNRQFETAVKHTKWATDVTEFTVGTSKVYVSPVLDLHDNRIVSADGKSALRASKRSPMAFAMQSAASLRTSDLWSTRIVRLSVPVFPEVLDPHSDGHVRIVGVGRSQSS